jgi:hypothetical protein
VNYVLHHVKVWAEQRSKSIAALLVPVVVLLAARAGLDLSDQQVAALVVILTPLGVYSAPANREQG